MAPGRLAGSAGLVVVPSLGAPAGATGAGGLFASCGAGQKGGRDAPVDVLQRQAGREKARRVHARSGQARQARAAGSDEHRARAWLNGALPPGSRAEPGALQGLLAAGFWRRGRKTPAWGLPGLERKRPLPCLVRRSREDHPSNLVGLWHPCRGVRIGEAFVPGPAARLPPEAYRPELRELATFAEDWLLCELESGASPARFRAVAVRPGPGMQPWS